MCGLCLALKQVAGQWARFFTSYDMAFVSVLGEARTGPVPLIPAGRCMLRAGRKAEVVPATAAPMRLASGAALQVGIAGLEDKATDGDLPPRLARVAGARLRRRAFAGSHLGSDDLGSDDLGDVEDAARRAVQLEGTVARSSGLSGLKDLLSSSGRAGAALFGLTCRHGGLGPDEGSLARAGEAFGRLAHLVDALEDRSADAEGGRFNPLDHCAVADEQALAYGSSLCSEVVGILTQAQWQDPALVVRLSNEVLPRALARSRRRRGALLSRACGSLESCAVSNPSCCCECCDCWDCCCA